MLIDVHTHYMPWVLSRALEKRVGAPRIFKNDGTTFIEYGEGSVQPMRSVFFEPDQILENMDQAGIDHSLLSVSIPGVDWLEDEEAEEVADASNHETAAIIARYPERFSGLATVPMQAPQRAVEVLKRAVGMGLKGAMIYSNVAGAHLAEPSRRVFFDAAAALDVPVMLHPTYPLCAPTVNHLAMMEIAGFLFDTTTAALRLVYDGLYERHPDFKFMVPHMGGYIPYIAGRVDFISKARPGAMGSATGVITDHIKRFYVDTVSGWPPAVRFCCDFFGADRIMFGTDHPFWPMSAGVRVLEEAGLSAEDREKIEHLTAERLFGIQVPAREGG